VVLLGVTIALGLLVATGLYWVATMLAGMFLLFLTEAIVDTIVDAVNDIKNEGQPGDIGYYGDRGMIGTIHRNTKTP
jgi:hypothetical protein